MFVGSILVEFLGCQTRTLDALRRCAHVTAFLARIGIIGGRAMLVR